MDQPLVSIVTPFYNTAPYIAECIESVLAQSYHHFEYILVDNSSTDGSSAIAESYAKRYGKIRVIRTSSLLPQVENYNFALTHISKGAEFCKIVQADDYIMPECIASMVRIFQQSARIGLVSAYDRKGDAVRGFSFPRGITIMSGKEAARMHLRDGIWVFGSPTTVMYRACLVRDCRPFYDESCLHEDTEKCFQIMRHWDLGFVPEVLSFLRTENESISAKSRDFNPDLLDWYINLRRFAPVFFNSDEAAALIANAKVEYYEMLAGRMVRLGDRAFWNYHIAGLGTIPERLDRSYLAWSVCRRILRRTAAVQRRVITKVTHSLTQHARS